MTSLLFEYFLNRGIFGSCQSANMLCDCAARQIVDHLAQLATVRYARDYTRALRTYRICKFRKECKSLARILQLRVHRIELLLFLLKTRLFSCQGFAEVSLWKT